LDGFEKMEEFNARYDMRFRMGLAKLWLPRGENFDVERVYICRMGAALDMIGYFYSQCRVLALGNFTTTTDAKRIGEVVDVENHGNRKFVAAEYLDKDGFRLKDYSLRTIRQRIRKLFLQEGVQPLDWNEEKAKGLIKAPGCRKGTSFIFYDAPTGAPSRQLLKERAKIRTEFALDNTARKTLPKLGGFKFGQMNFGSKTVERMDISKMARVQTGNGVKEEILSPNYKSFPELAMVRYDQERGLNLDVERVTIPKVVRQATPEDVKKKVVTVPIPSRELAAKKAVEEELARIKAVQDEERRRQSEPTSLVGAVKALNVKNANVKILAKDARPTGGAQQRLRQRSVVRKVEPRDRSSSGSSVQYLGERKRSPEKERERGTTSASSVNYDSSDNEEKDEIRLLQAKVDVLTAKLERMKARYEMSRPRRK
jgi:hypothetical protein